jgi:hypothetical protein
MLASAAVIFRDRSFRAPSGPVSVEPETVMFSGKSSGGAAASEGWAVENVIRAWL